MNGIYLEKQNDLNLTRNEKEKGDISSQKQSEYQNMRQLQI